MREFGSLAVFSLVSFFFMPLILAQKESRREPPSGWGGFKFMPCAFAEARPLAFKPPFSDLPSLRCHAGDLAIIDSQVSVCGQRHIDAFGKSNPLTGKRQ